MTKIVGLFLVVGSLWSIDCLAFDSHYRALVADQIVRGSGFVSSWSSHRLGAQPPR